MQQVIDLTHGEMKLESNDNNTETKPTHYWYPAQGVDIGTTNFAACTVAYTFDPDGTLRIAINKDKSYASNLLAPGAVEHTEPKYQNPTNYEYLHRKIMSYYKDYPEWVLRNMLFVNEQQWFNTGKGSWQSCQMMIVNVALDMIQRQWSRMVYETHPNSWKARMKIMKAKGSGEETRTQIKKRSMDLAKTLMGDFAFDQVVGSSDHVAEAFLIVLDQLKQMQVMRRQRVTQPDGKVLDQPYPSNKVDVIVVTDKKFLNLLDPLRARSMPSQS